MFTRTSMVGGSVQFLLGSRTRQAGSSIVRWISDEVKATPMESTKATTSPATTVERQLERLQERAEGDAYLHMLSTPLRRCAITGLTLPKALMFSTIPFKTQAAKYSVPESVRQALMQQERELRSRVVRRPSNVHRWAYRQARPLLLKQLARSRRMAKHKVVTAQTTESKERFVAQLEAIKQQIGVLQKPFTSKSTHLVVASTQEERWASKERKNEDGLPLIRAGKAIWCLLSPKAAGDMVKVRSKEKKFLHTPENTMEAVERQLEAQVIREAKEVVQRATSSTPDELSQRAPAVIERLRSGTSTSNAAAVISMDERSNPTPGVSLAGEEPKHPVYLLGGAWLDSNAKNEFRAMLDEMAEWGTAANASERAAEGSMSEEGSTASRESLEPNHMSSYVVRQDKATMYLCVALWRLNSWRTALSSDRAEQSRATVKANNEMEGS